MNHIWRPLVEKAAYQMVGPPEDPGMPSTISSREVAGRNCAPQGARANVLWPSGFQFSHHRRRMQRHGPNDFPESPMAVRTIVTKDGKTAPSTTCRLRESGDQRLLTYSDDLL